MSEYAQHTGDREAFFAALARVFEEYRDVSAGYGISDLTRLAGMVGGDLANSVGVSRAENGRIVTEFSDRLLHPIDEQPEDECWTYSLDLTTDPPSWVCVVYLTS